MKVIIVLALVSLAYANVVPSAIEGNTAYGYIQNYAIPLAEEIREAEEQMNKERIIGGITSNVGQFPYQAGLLFSYVGINGNGVCGGVLVSANRVITAAHCWFDGINQAWLINVVLGSNTIFFGGTRLDTSAIAVHPNWSPSLARNDVAVIYLPTPVPFSNVINPIALPSGSQLTEDFTGSTGTASGFGLTSPDSGIQTSQTLSHVNLPIISNTICSFAFPFLIQTSNICTSGLGSVGTCRGDSGGPLAVTRNGVPILVGITSFGSAVGCDAGFPSVFARITSFIDFFNQHVQ